MIRVNDEPVEHRFGMTVAVLLREHGYAPATVAVWIDDQMVRRETYEDMPVPDGADVKVVLMAAGG
jgi:thiamine biosynthesis protein ThiS